MRFLRPGQDHPDVRAVIPRRSALPVDRGVLIVAHATHKQKALFFFLVQARSLRCADGQTPGTAL